jgi:hypothetical protein
MTPADPIVPDRDTLNALDRAGMGSSPNGGTEHGEAGESAGAFLTIGMTPPSITKAMVLIL